MDNKMRLIDSNPLIDRFSGGDELKSMSESLHDSIFVEELRNAPTVDAVPVDEIIFHHLLIDENGIPEVKLQFGERILILRREDDPVDLAEVVHGWWVDRYGEMYANHLYECSVCKQKALYKVEVDELDHERIVQDLSDFCPHCGATMDGIAPRTIKSLRLTEVSLVPDAEPCCRINREEENNHG